MLAMGRSAEREACYLCGGRRDLVADPVPAPWLYARSPPAAWPTAALCRRCLREREPADRALRDYVAAEIERWSPSPIASAPPPRPVRDAIDKLVRGLHRIVHGAAAPPGTTLWLVERSAPPLPAPEAPGVPAARASVYDLGADFHVDHAAVRIHHHWYVTYFGVVSFHAVTCPPLSDALATLMPGARSASAP